MKYTRPRSTISSKKNCKHTFIFFCETPDSFGLLPKPLLFEVDARTRSVPPERRPLECTRSIHTDPLEGSTPVIFMPSYPSSLASCGQALTPRCALAEILGWQYCPRGHITLAMVHVTHQVLKRGFRVVLSIAVRLSWYGESGLFPTP